MPQVSNSTEGIRKWFRQCPLLSKNKRFGADYLGENPTEYAIYASPSTLTYHENILGDYVLDDKQTQNYIFATRENFGADVKSRFLYGFDCVDGRAEQCPKLPLHRGGSGLRYRSHTDRVSIADWC